MRVCLLIIFFLTNYQFADASFLSCLRKLEGKYLGRVDQNLLDKRLNTNLTLKNGKKVKLESKFFRDNLQNRVDINITVISKSGEITIVTKSIYGTTIKDGIAFLQQDLKGQGVMSYIYKAYYEALPKGGQIIVDSGNIESRKFLDSVIEKIKKTDSYLSFLSKNKSTKKIDNYLNNELNKLTKSYIDKQIYKSNSEQSPVWYKVLKNAGFEDIEIEAIRDPDKTGYNYQFKATK